MVRTGFLSVLYNWQQRELMVKRVDGRRLLQD